MREPVWCVFTGCMGGGEEDVPGPVRGAVADRGGADMPFTLGAACANGWTTVGTADAGAEGPFANALVENGNEGKPVG